MTHQRPTAVSASADAAGSNGTFANFTAQELVFSDKVKRRFIKRLKILISINILKESVIRESSPPSLRHAQRIVV